MTEIKSNSAASELLKLEEKIRSDPFFDYMRKSRFVPGYGRINKPDLMFIGEAPGRMENASQKPFQGKAGKIFNETLSLTGYNRQEVYVTNSVKYMPVDEDTGKFRKPTNEEINNSRSYVLEEIAIIKPQIICLLGNVALRTIFPDESSVANVRGRFMYEEHFGNICIVTYHPSFFQYPGNAKFKTLIEDDFRMLKDYVQNPNDAIARFSVT